jgi:hypothetical protein
MKRCAQCGTQKLEAEFPSVPAGYRATFCVKCAHRNMVAWEFGEEAAKRRFP